MRQEELLLAEPADDDACDDFVERVVREADQEALLHRSADAGERRQARVDAEAPAEGCSDDGVDEGRKYVLEVRRVPREDELFEVALEGRDLVLEAEDLLRVPAVHVLSEHDVAFLRGQRAGHLDRAQMVEVDVFFC